MQSSFVSAVLLYILVCAQAAASDASTVPDDFPDPKYLKSFPLNLKPATIERRLAKSGCGYASADMSKLGLDSGLITRPSTSDELYIDKGGSNDGLRWFALRKASDPETAYCGIVLVRTEGGSTVSVLGVNPEKTERAIKAVASGEFFCKCQELGR